MFAFRNYVLRSKPIYSQSTDHPKLPRRNLFMVCHSTVRRYVSFRKTVKGNASTISVSLILHLVINIRKLHKIGMSVKEMAGIHNIDRNKESNGFNNCKQNRYTNSSHMVTVFKELQLSRRYVMERL